MNEDGCPKPVIDGHMYFQKHSLWISRLIPTVFRLSPTIFRPSPTACRRLHTETRLLHTEHISKYLNIRGILAVPGSKTFKTYLNMKTFTSKFAYLRAYVHTGIISRNAVNQTTTSYAAKK